MQLINIHLLVLAALVARLVVVFVHDRVYHPDEIFQYLEQAHRLTFGYGYVLDRDGMRKRKIILKHRSRTPSLLQDCASLPALLV
jgi:hypothetical protein